MTGTPVDVGRLLRDLHAARAEVEQLRGIVQRIAEVCDLMSNSPLEAVQMWAQLDLQPALAGGVEVETLEIGP